MAFNKVTKQLTIEDGARARFTFHSLIIAPSGRPPTLSVRHAGADCPGWSNAIAKLPNDGGAGAAHANPAKRREARAQLARLIADCGVVLSWTDVCEDGATEDAPCTPDKVYEFLCAVIDANGSDEEWVLFAAYVQTAANFRPPIANVSALGKG